MGEPVHEVVIVGGGFGGLYAARGLRRADVRVTLIDRRNFHLFQPLLYQVATGALAPANIATPLRAILKNQANARVLLGEVEGFDLAAKEVVLTDGRVRFDTLIVAAGARHAYFGRPEWEDLAPGLKSVEDATEIRRRVLYAFEMAERTAETPMLCDCWLTFVVVGGGPTGVEMAGAISELARDTLRKNFRTIDPGRARVLLVQSADRVLPAFHEKSSLRANAALERMGVEVRLNTRVTDVRKHAVTLKGAAGPEDVLASTVVWAAGVQASPLGERLAAAAGTEVDRAGRVPVGPDLTLPGRPDVFVVGDLAVAAHPAGGQVPGVAPAAMQMGAYAARVVKDRLAGRETAPFKYWDKGNMATIGRARAVAEAKGFRLSGFPAWLAWLFVHVMFLVQFSNRVVVVWQWFWNFITYNRTARLITGEPSKATPMNSLAAGIHEVVPEGGMPAPSGAGPAGMSLPPVNPPAH
ncbi:pyridine nucleotide-disulfide oxidoreductase : NADH dehydrogenase (Ubiquinone) OS=Nostoc sp. PCC 7107 GN=Nos7107_5176 PE=4 SV=1: Pyr_redox_2: Pyr_redox [Gemmataceae bacterium]|nr:pyridine nucleotide-disulfide oxidoreductase : NADH dehydrogenase (Ubiquinone) OS=Nostoc sp. PCC 7107 GN=Nos7107_5176 PE=4 SV=1: Pyr_redox_2: Pyr_redox [Gemmataceae bacterium]VTT98620.1 pyridine nucleotide-disulfide oxidoreductase : NADH dehydrogenase (Ubiquinone) OS=Nostoc sp. PCC 7107 GN=Nos7107_5176 PE=4 SV=1: Pyr_redox_2: Pyr_redox [Gemmataceae bacterium]